MAITVNTNMSSLICQRSLTKATSGMNTALQRMSTGLKINSAKDDAAGCAISSKMDYKLSSYGVAQDNAQMGQSMLDTASGSLSVMNGMLQRMRDLSEQAANGTYGKEERQAMQAEVDALTKELYRIKNTTDFNGKKVLGEEENTGYVKPDISINDIDVANITQAEWDSKYKGAVIGISTAGELEKLATLTNDKLIDSTGTTYALTNDIKMSDTLDASGSNHTAIGNRINNSFNGNFNGNGYTIENLKINTTKTIATDESDDCQGLFGYCSTATIENITITNSSIKGARFVGGIVGYGIAKSTVKNCKVEGTINGNSYVGGIVGYSNNQGLIDNSIANVKITGSSKHVGGIVGCNYFNSTVSNCSASGSVTGEQNVGGIAGSNLRRGSYEDTDCLIKNSYSNCIITGRTSGGIAGSNTNSQILNSACDITKSTKSAVGDNNPITNKVEVQDLTTNPFTISIPAPYQPNSTPVETNLQIGINVDENSVITVDTAFSMSGYNIDLSSEESARHSISRLDKLMATVNAKQLDIGATSNRLTSTMEFQSVQMSALTSANSLIKDADIAKESASYIKNQILQQTTATLLATANQNPSIALSLV